MNVNFPPNWHGPEETGAKRTPTKVEQAAKDYIEARDAFRDYNNADPYDTSGDLDVLLNDVADTFAALKQALAEAGL